MKDKISLPKENLSLWQEFNSNYEEKNLKDNISTDVCIIGAGMTGIITAYILKQKGIRCCVLESGSLLSGATLNTTAEITLQHDLIYSKIIDYLGVESALQYYNSNLEGFKFIENTINENNINCDYKTQDSYIYTNKYKHLIDLEKELKAYEKIKITGEMTNSFFAGFLYKQAIKMKEQAQFNHIKYLNFLLSKIQNVYTKTKAVKVDKEGSKLKVISKNGPFVKCDNIVIATNFPFDGKRGLYHARMYPEISYVIGAKCDNIPEGIYNSIEYPLRRIRSAYTKNDKILIIGGESQKLIQKQNYSQKFNNLKKFGIKNFNINNVIYKWCSKEAMTVDNLPFVGRFDENIDNIYIATGFGKWGITNAVSSAIIIQKYITNENNPYADVFSPSRFNSSKVKTFLIQKTDMK